MDIPLEWLYTGGNYYLVENLQEDRKNIYSKGKYPDRDSFLKHCKKHLTDEHIDHIDDGNSVLVEQEDGTALYFRHINI